MPTLRPAVRPRVQMRGAGDSFAREQQRALARAAVRQRIELDELRHLNEELLDFAATAAHDLAAPLTTVASYLKLIKRRRGDELSDDVAELIDQALGGAERMRALIDGILEHSRMGAPAVYSTFVLHEVIDEALNDLEADIARSRAEVRVGETPEVFADRHALGRVFTNLICNAIKYATPGERPRIAIAAIEHPRSWEISGAAAGPGSAPD